LIPREQVMVRVAREDGTSFAFGAIARVDSPVEIRYYQNGGILQTVLRRLLGTVAAPAA
jgi:aconitate hydratase